ncbi:poly(U)-specific 3'-to-5' RNA exonuclease [Neophaeococcomyces mojaviensis]|uniref:Poly(U)-specific 3'-to-5' RNA exonuclease n=1 Tax=Neophaeococcomyces mojaviensis TaxID=3383035 RepID=A0ACC3AA43_9EURO|nr:poly(U)-specific 3'-to-5' RNA exonuclease [Knufia sp. JES_112]
MSLVDYPDSDDENQEPIEAVTFADASSLKRKTDEDGVSARRVRPKLPPALPSSFHTLYSADVRTSTNDDPILHGGRQRQVPHVVGNWPSFMYLEWSPSEPILTRLVKVTEQAESRLRDASVASTGGNRLHSLLLSDLGVRQPLHVSLSSPLILTTDNKDKFELEIKKAVRDAGLSTFKAVSSGLRWVSNFDQSRYFLILILAQPQNDELNILLKRCNEVCRTFDLPELYIQDRLVGVSKHTDPGIMSSKPLLKSEVAHDKFHISIAWTLAPPNDGFEDNLVKFDSVDIEVSFNSLYIKIGNTVSRVSFEATDDHR